MWATVAEVNTKPSDKWNLACCAEGLRDVAQIEEIEFTVGCSHLVAHVLAHAFPGRTRQVECGADVPSYRDQPE